MLTREDNELITQVGPDKPMGQLFRRFWLPVLLSEDLPNADGEPVRFRILGEDLIGFRDTEGRVGIMDAYCPHRGAPLFYGRNEECGIRCVYHGWKFDVEGNCVDIPNVPEGATYKNKVKAVAYPAWEKGGLIWAYMGPAEHQPPYPEFEWLDMPASHRYVKKFVLQCNYLQGMEGDYDASHASFLHSTLDGNQSNPGARLGGRRTIFQGMPRYVAIEETGAGLVFVASRDLEGNRRAFNVSHWMMPIFCTAGITAGADTSSSNMRIPIDDQTTMFFRLRWADHPIPEKELNEYRFGGYTYPELMPGTLLPKENRENDYRIDRVAQKHWTYSGIKTFPLQDIAMMEDQRGSIMDRTKEHLVSSDSAIIQVRRRLLTAVRDLQNGHEPAAARQPGAYRVRTIQTIVPDDVTPDDVVKPLIQRALAHQVSTPA